MKNLYDLIIRLLLIALTVQAAILFTY